MSYPMTPSPFHRHCGLVHDIFGDEYYVVKAVYDRLDELKGYVRDIHHTIDVELKDKTSNLLNELNLEFGDLKNKLEEYIICAQKDVYNKLEQEIVAAREGIARQARKIQLSIDEYGEAVAQSVANKALDKIDNAVEDKINSYSSTIDDIKSLVDTAIASADTRLSSLSEEKIAEIKKVQSDFQILDYKTNTGDVVNLPQPQNTQSSAILFHTETDEGKNTVTIYRWDVTKGNWENTGATFLPPKDGKDGSPGNDGKDGEAKVELIKGAIEAQGADDYVRLTFMMQWDGGANAIQDIKWPGGYIFKTGTITPEFRSSVSGSPITDPLNSNVSPSVTNVVNTGFRYKHTGIWPGNSQEKLAMTIVAVPDYDAMKANGWVEPPKKPSDTNTGKNTVDGVPIGTVLLFYNKLVGDSRFLVLDGSEYSKDSYPDLFAKIGTTKLIKADGTIPRATGTGGTDGSLRGGYSTPEYQGASTIPISLTPGEKFFTYSPWNPAEASNTGYFDGDLKKTTAFYGMDFGNVDTGMANSLYNSYGFGCFTGIESSGGFNQGNPIDSSNSMDGKARVVLGLPRMANFNYTFVIKASN